VLGAHLGVPEVTRGFFDREGFRVRMLMYEHSSMLYDEFRRVDPSLDRDLVRIEPGSVGYMLEVKDLVERGEWLGILGDRPWMTGGTVRLPFLGAERDFPTGPYELACVLKCPILLMFMVKGGGARQYDLHIELLAGRDDLPGRADRRRGVEALAARFVGRLEHYARTYPTQWYNFHDFWPPNGGREGA
jgi:predicted LPLAT superfamily acyltransferase